jgi:cell division protein FtsZ
VGVVTLPFGFEGARRRRVADEGVARLREVVDALIVIPNDRLLNLAERSTSIVQAFRLADDMLRHGVQGIADLVTVTGLINLDFADVRSIMQDAGSALMAIGEGSGDDRAAQAARAVVASPLLEHSIDGASGILLNVTGGPDLTLHEVSEVAEFVTQATSADANVILGAEIHPRPEAEIRVTLIATGMPEKGQPPPRLQRATPTSQFQRPSPQPASGTPSRAPESPPPSTRPVLEEPRDETFPPQQIRPAPLPDDIDPLDVPPFLRRPR